MSDGLRILGAGERVAIAGGGYVILDELDDSRDRFVEEVQRILHSSELSSRAKILRRKPELVDLYRDMQIDFVKRAGKCTGARPPPHCFDSAGIAKSGADPLLPSWSCEQAS